LRMPSPCLPLFDPAGIRNPYRIGV
jgi:hypothetical protein